MMVTKLHRTTIAVSYLAFENGIRLVELSETAESLGDSLLDLTVPLIALLATVSGILMFTAEAQHGTLAATLTARPTCWDLGNGSAITSRALWALVYIALVAVIGLGVGMIVGTAPAPSPAS